MVGGEAPRTVGGGGAMVGGEALRTVGVEVPCTVGGEVPCTVGELRGCVAVGAWGRCQAAAALSVRAAAPRTAAG